MSATLARSLITLGLVLRIALVAIMVPSLQTGLFVPFLDHVRSNPGLDPWSSWVAQGGATEAFPYGVVMLWYFAAFSWLGTVVPVADGAQLGIAIGVLVAELAAWRLVASHSPDARRRGVVGFAIAPIVLFAAYVHGQLDILPALISAASLLALRARRDRTAGLLLGLAIATKLSVLLIVPVLVVFMLRNRRYAAAARRMLPAMLPGIALAVLPMLSPGFWTMVVETPQIESLFAYGIDLGSNLVLLWAPVVLAAIVVAAWHYRRANLDILLVLCALVLAVVPVLAPASPGWFLWAVPLLVVIAAELRLRYQAMLVLFFSITAVWGGIESSWGSARFAVLDPIQRWALELLGDARTGALPALAGTAMVAISAVALWQIVAAALNRYDRYRLSSAPLSLVVAGDSGTGKDTLCAAVADAFVGSRSAFVLGDDYHLYERGSPVWQAKTHLDPAANSLTRLTRDSLQLLDGVPVWTRHYDHERGRFTKPRKVNDGELIMISGLHTLSTSLRERTDLSVYLDMDEPLRTLLKMQRDVRERGHDPDSVVASIARRQHDRERYVQPQSRVADVVLRLEPSLPLPTDPRDMLDLTPSIDVRASLRDSLMTEDLVRTLTSLASAQVDWAYHDTPGETSIRVAGADWISAADIDAVARTLIERPTEVMLGSSQWWSGSRGVCQLIVVLSLLERRTRRTRS